MSWTDEELDKLVQDASNAQKVEYKDAYWQEMEALLNQKPARKIAGWWWFSAGVVLVAISTIGFVVFGPTSRPEINVMAQTMNSEYDQNVQTTPNKTTLLEDEVQGSEINHTTSMTSVSSTTNSTNNRSSNGLVKTIKSSKSQPKINLITTKNEIQLTSIQNLDNDQKAFLEKQSLKSLSSKVDQKQEVQGAINHPLNVEGLELIAWSNDITREIPIYPNEWKDLPFLPRNHLGFYVELNGGIGQSYQKTATQNELYQIGLNAGLEFHRKNWVFGAGLGIRQQYVNNLEINNRRSYYSFGLVNMDQHLEYDQLIFADLTFHTNYIFGRSAIGLSVTPNYLVGTRLSYTETSEEVFGESHKIETLEERKSTFVSSNNFEKFGINAGFHYNYALRPNLLLNLEVNSRLGKQLLISNFEGEKRNYPLMIELGIKHKF